jgi:hypothetical protein
VHGRGGGGLEVLGGPLHLNAGGFGVWWTLSVRDDEKDCENSMQQQQAGASEMAWP